MKLDYVIEVENPVPLVKLFLTSEEVGVPLKEVAQISISGNARHQAQVARLVSDAVRAANKVQIDTALVALETAYSTLPVTASAEEFVCGEGNWGLTEAEAAVAQGLADAIQTLKKTRC